MGNLYRFPPMDKPLPKYKLIQELISEQRFLNLHADYIRVEHSHLRQELKHAQNEVTRIRSVPLSVAQFVELVDSQHALVSLTSGTTYLSRLLSTLNLEDFKPGHSVGIHRHSHALVRSLPPDADSSIRLLKPGERPDVKYSDIGGLDIQKQELREAVELPLQNPQIYQQLGIDPPSGVLLYGPPGTGKTMLAKAIAHHTEANFIHMVGSEFVQKWLGEGARLVRDTFRLARQNKPCIIFIDEIDSIATKRFDAQTGADREVQRILLQILTEMDGFDEHTGVKVIMATNRPDTLDPALLRPGRLDRKIEFPAPDKRQRRLIYQTVLSNMNISEEVDIEDLVQKPEQLTGAEIAAVCQESGLLALRANRFTILPEDLEAAFNNVMKRTSETHNFYRW